MAYPIMEHVSARRERQLRREWRRDYKALGHVYPKLATIALVELDAIKTPEWAWAKAIPGLTRTDKSIWLRRILARTLYREDQEEGGNPKITFTSCRPCKICLRVLLGIEAEHRWSLDLKWEGWRIPCSPECVEIERANIESKQQRKPAAQRKGK